MCCLDIFEPHRAPKTKLWDLTLPSPDMPLTEWESLILLVPPSARLGLLPLALNLTGFTSLPAHEIIQTNQYHPPIGTRGHHALLLIQSLSPTTSALSLYSWVQHLCGPALHSVSSPRLWVCVTDKVLSVSHFQYWVLCIWPSPSSRDGDPSFHQGGEGEVDKLSITVRQIFFF